MTRRFPMFRRIFTTLTLLAGTSLVSLAFAQGPDGPPPPGGPGGRGGQGSFGGPGGFGRGQFGGTPSAANTPVSVLESGLKLTADQKTKIQQLQQQMQQQMRELFPRPGAGGPPDPETMQANITKMRGLDQKVSTQIEALLTADQKAKLPGLLKDIEALRGTGIPMEVYKDLKLTADQKAKLAAISKKSQQTMQSAIEQARNSGDFGSVREAMMNARRQTEEQAMDVLSDDQRKIVTQYKEEHPQQGPGGFGGPGGGPGGRPGPGGPPPGAGGPPPAQS